jgi:quercetin dioxygenase-like cupin family protein
MPRLAVAVAIIAGVLGLSGMAQGPGPMALTADEIVFSTEGLAMPGMAQANLVGHPDRSGRYTIRLKFPDGYRIEPHFHPDAREVTILSGTYLTGYGSTFDERLLKALPAGSFYTEPANVPHFIVTSGPVTIQVSGIGPSSRIFTKPSHQP